MEDNITELNDLAANKMAGILFNTTQKTKGGDVIVTAGNMEELELTRFIVQRLLVPLIVLIGVSGNSVSICVLTHRSMKSSTNCYLTFLAVFDALYLVTCFTLSFKHYPEIKDSMIYIFWYPRGRVLSDMWANASVCLTVTFTIERYVAVCHPMKGKAICTPKRARLIALVVAILSIGCTFPEFWEWETVEVASGNITKYKNKRTSFAETSSYAIGYSWFIVCVFTFVPLIALCSFNSILIHSVYKASKIRQSMTNNTMISKPGDKHSAEQSRITLMLISVALVFIICQLPTAFMIIYQTYLDLAEPELTMTDYNNLRIGGNVTNLLLLINAAINFILYSVMSTKFRRVFKRMINRLVPGRKNVFANFDYSLYTGSSYFRGSVIKPSFRGRNSSYLEKDNTYSSVRGRNNTKGNWVTGRNSESLLHCSSESLYLNRSLLKSNGAHARRSFPSGKDNSNNSNDTSL